MLTTIMNMQKDFQERLGVDFTNMTDKERAAFMRDHRGYLEDEVAEALYEMPYYKSWKNYESMTDAEKAEAWSKVRMELVDALHFFTNLLLAAGFTPEMLYNMYVHKNLENHRRQDAGYTADVSYREQCVDDVMNAPKCVISMDGTTERSDDFIAIINNTDGTTSLRYNTDALSMGMAVKLVAKAYVEMLSNCSTKEREEIESVIGEVGYKEVVHG